jgi:RimJ/RimL family protein N-acetyltransferase
MSTLADGDYDVNELGQPIGRELRDWHAPAPPPRAVLTGRFCRVEPAELERHASDLHAANLLDRDGRMWTYLAYGPFATEAGYREWLAPRQHSDDPMFFAIMDNTTGRAAGLASYLRIDPPQGAIEVGHLAYSPLLQRTRAATEAMYLMMKYAFALGYRRYEWKCNALNEPSCRAAERLGFKFEGIFRQATISKGRTRDTAWYSIIDREWPALAAAYEAWLAPVNFDTDGRQRVSLGQLTRALREHP